MTQSSFDFPFLDHYLDDDFLISTENIQAFNFISNYNQTDSNLPKIFAIYGKKDCGKTHLVHIWQRKMAAEFLQVENLADFEIANLITPNQAYIIENIENIANQTALFHIFNIILERNGYLLLTSGFGLNKINYNFADLASRLNNVFSIEIQDPQIDFIQMLLIKKFADKQLVVEDKVTDFLAKNIDRDYQEISKIVRLLEFYCFEEKKKITIPFVANILAKNKITA